VQKPDREILGRTRRFANTAWSLVGISLVAICIFELSLRSLSFVKDKWIDDPWVNHGVFPDTDSDYHPKWESQFEQEYSASWAPEWHSYVYWRRPAHRGELINIDSRGVRRTWRVPADSPAQSARRKRVFVFGGSTVWGTGARDDYTIPSFLAKQLAEEGVEADVINYGESAYVMMQEVIALLLRLNEGDVPDAVVFYDGFNDAFTAYQNGAAGIPQNEFNRRAEFGLLQDHPRLRKEYLRRLPAEFQGISRLATAARRRIVSQGFDPIERPPTQPPTDGLARDVIRGYEANIKMVQALADEYRFSCHFFWQPALVTKKHLSPTEARRANRAEPWKDFLLTVYDGVRTSKIVSQNKHFEDISSIFDEVTTMVYLDWAHVTEEGNELIAQRISRRLLPALQNTE
jgi:lysophospholipase L1-like esterase